MGHISGSLAGTTVGNLKRINVLPNRRMPHIVTAIGDSRVAALWLDGARRIRNGRSPLNWANALLGQRMVISIGFGVSDNRTDQMLPRLASAIATNAGLLYIKGGVNGIEASYPSTATNGATAFADIMTMAEAARLAGMIVVIEAEVGSQSFTAAKIAQLNELNARLYEYAEATPGVHVHDARTAVLIPASSDTALAFKAGLAVDGVHVNARGAVYWGESLAALLGALMPPRAMTLGRNRVELPSKGRRQLSLNPMFASASGGLAVNAPPVRSRRAGVADGIMLRRPRPFQFRRTRRASAITSR